MIDYYILHSGGMDSTTALALATQQIDARKVYAVGVNYGQRHVKELDAADRIRQLLDVDSLTLDLTGYGESVTSALTSDDVSVPDGHYADDNMKITVVPGRNAVMLSALAGAAASITDADDTDEDRNGPTAIRLVTAVHAGDHAVYADCRPEFITAMETALRAGVRDDLSIWAPFVNVSKTDIASIAAQVAAPVSMSWSCYKGGDVHCGTCGTCVERKEAFEDSGVPDETEYLA